MSEEAVGHVCGHGHGAAPPARTLTMTTKKPFRFTDEYLKRAMAAATGETIVFEDGNGLGARPATSPSSPSCG